MVRALCVCVVLTELAAWVMVSGQWCAPKLFETKKWTLMIRQTDQGAEIVESISSLSFDVIGQRLASHETGTRSGQPYSVFHLYYYPAGELYTVQDGVCTASPLTGNVTDPCFSYTSGAHVIDYLTKEYIGDARDGSPIMGGIFYQSGIGSFYSFDVEGNIPLFEGREGEIDGVPTYTVSSYLNVTLGISDPSVFTPPDSCIKAQVSKAPLSKHHSVILDL
ncbi:uncharacterized protein LOC143296436 [Babylonia areolata]|uniref:uncharacterized protein LOC143296436 n=1 Tax=Babylonia areolata TaxID=304850 RepID=UPI003FD4F42F